MSRIANLEPPRFRVFEDAKGIVCHRRRVRTLAIALSVAIAATSCSTYESLKTEFDSVARIDLETRSEPAKYELADAALRYIWWQRWFDGVGVAEVTEALFGLERTKHEVDNPDEFLRDCILSMSDAAGRDELRQAEVSWRLSYVVENDPTPLNRMVALHELGSILDKTGEKPTNMADTGITTPVTADYKARARKLVHVLEPLWPERRTLPWSQQKRDDYATAMRDLLRLRPATLTDERIRERAVLEALRSEFDVPIERLTRGYLKANIATLCWRTLAHAIEDPDANVREAAILELWAHVGPPALPWMLARLGRRSERLGYESAPLDPDPRVRRRLIQCCWALTKEAASRPPIDDTNPLQFLQSVYSFDEEPSHRHLAALALAHILSRDPDPLGVWIPEWWQSFVTSKGQGTEPSKPTERVRGH